MLGQLNLWGKTKVEVAIDRLQSFEPKEGYYLAFSGGKDSQCIYHLAKQARVKFDAHYRVTGLDPPELVRFIKDHYPDVEFEIPKDKDGKRITMWSLIVQQVMPPTRIARYCCEHLKESGGKGRVTITGVRWAESSNRQENQGAVSIITKSKRLVQKLTDEDIEFRENRKGGIVLNDDNDSSRRAVEFCYRTWKTMVNPIIDWDDSDVWEYLNEWAKVPHCSLYDEGYARLGCIGCPMGGSKKQKEDFARWPKYRQLYINAFEKMGKERLERGLQNKEEWSTAENVMRWWLNEKEREG